MKTKKPELPAEEQREPETDGDREPATGLIGNGEGVDPRYIGRAG